MKKFELTKDERDVLFEALDLLSEDHPENSETRHLIDSIWNKVIESQDARH
jgi:uncharacterized membrane-anchored protein